MTGFHQQAIKIQDTQKAGIFLKAERSLKTLLHRIYGSVCTHIISLCDCSTTLFCMALSTNHYAPQLRYSLANELSDKFQLHESKEDIP
jgi:hypothetical protein